jgi:YidC/Oxa1 family membrane protein insertase
MDYRKTALYAALVVVALLLFNAWQREFPPQDTTAPQQTVVAPNAPGTQSATANSSSVPNVPQVGGAKQRATTPKPLQAKNQGGYIQVKTDRLNLLIDTHGGNIEQADLLQYPKSLGSKQKMQLFNTNSNTFYVAQSGLTGKQGPDTQKRVAQYQSAQKNYTLKPGQKTLNVDLQWRNNQGLMVTKTYTFHRGSYAIDMHYTVNNKAGAPWTGYVYTQLARKQPPSQGSVISHIATFTGAAISSPTEHYQKLKFSSFADSPLSQDITGGWAAMIQHYFLSAWVPPANESYHYYTEVNGNGLYTVGMIGSPLTVQPGKTITTTNKLYVGPAIADNLNTLSPYLSMTIDYGWLWFISKLIFWIMSMVHTVVHNWGWSIILTTVIIKIAFFPLSDKSFRSMAGMRKLQPKMAQLKERFGDDRAAMSKATMALYKTEKINPLSGCLPIVIQIPVFIALYWVLIQSVEMRQAPFLLWVTDLSVHDPFYILPVIMGFLMFLQQKLSPPPADPTQAKVMMFLPVIFTVFFLRFPSGLVLYWITNTLFTICHQFYVYKKVDREDNAEKKTKALKR